MAYSASVQWMPTTGEFGPRGGFGDLEHHEKLATRFGSSYAYAPDEYRAAPLDQPKPNETQLRLSDGVYAFETGALADSVTVEYPAIQRAGHRRRAQVPRLVVPVGVLTAQAFRFRGRWPATVDVGHGLRRPGPLGYMVVPRRALDVVSGGYVWDQFKRYPYEFSPGLSFYPMGTRSWRLNLHTINVHKSPTGSSFGYYAAGQTGGPTRSARTSFSDLGIHAVSRDRFPLDHRHLPDRLRAGAPRLEPGQRPAIQFRQLPVEARRRLDDHPDHRRAERHGHDDLLPDPAIRVHRRGVRVQLGPGSLDG